MMDLAINVDVVVSTHLHTFQIGNNYSKIIDGIKSITDDSQRNVFLHVRGSLS